MLVRGQLVKTTIKNGLLKRKSFSFEHIHYIWSLLRTKKFDNLNIVAFLYSLSRRHKFDDVNHTCGGAGYQRTKTDHDQSDIGNQLIVVRSIIKWIFHRNMNQRRNHQTGN